MSEEVSNAIKHAAQSLAQAYNFEVIFPTALPSAGCSDFRMTQPEDLATWKHLIQQQKMILGVAAFPDEQTVRLEEGTKSQSQTQSCLPALDSLCSWISTAMACELSQVSWIFGLVQSRPLLQDGGCVLQDALHELCSASHVTQSRELTGLSVHDPWRGTLDIFGAHLPALEECMSRWRQVEQLDSAGVQIHATSGAIVEAFYQRAIQQLATCPTFEFGSTDVAKLLKVCPVL